MARKSNCFMYPLSKRIKIFILIDNLSTCTTIDNVIDTDSFKNTKRVALNI